VRLLLLAVLVLPPGVSATAQKTAQKNVPPMPAPTVDASDAKRWPGKATLEATKRAAESRPLFETNEPLALSLIADFEEVQKDRDSASQKMYPATIVVTGRGAAETSIPVRIRTRGHSRLRPEVCTFAPLRIEFPSNPAGTVFEGQKRLKLGTFCRDFGDYPQYVVREYAVYRMFNVLTPRSFHAKLAEVKYVDAASRKTIEVRTGLFLEDADDVARRLEGRVSNTTVLDLGGLDPAASTVMMLFEFMIGNTDVSIRAMHNVRIVLTPSGTRYPVPYDFDYSGVVDAVYAAPSPFLPAIQSVRQRVYLGPCRTPAQLEEPFAQFRTARTDLMAVYDSIPQLQPKHVNAAKKYLDEFYRTIQSPDSVKRAFLDGCGKQPYF
jgi:hypothetical protein